MLGLMYVGAAALYVLLLVLVVRWAWRAGRANGGSLLKACGFALVGFLVVYLPAFWNYLPIALTHRALCAKDAGFTVATTPERWAAANRDRIAELRGVDLTKSTPSRQVPSGFSRYEFFGGMLAREVGTTIERRLGMQFMRVESRLIDVRTGADMAREVGYAIGPREDVRVWLLWLECPTRADGAAIPSIDYITKLEELIK